MIINDIDHYRSRGVPGRNLLPKTLLMSADVGTLRLKSLSLHSKRFPSETMDAFKALFACNRPGHSWGEMLELEDSALGTSSFLMILAISRWHTHCDIKDPVI